MESSTPTASSIHHGSQPDDLPAGAIQVIRGNLLRGMEWMNFFASSLLLREWHTGHLYFVARDPPPERPLTSTRFVRSLNFTNDASFVYTSYFADFGPLDLGITYQFCRNLQNLMNEATEHRKYVVFYAGSHEHKKANSAACLMAYLVRFSYLSQCFHMQKFIETLRSLSEYLIRFSSKISQLNAHFVRFLEWIPRLWPFAMLGFVSIRFLSLSSISLVRFERLKTWVTSTIVRSISMRIRRWPSYKMGIYHGLFQASLLPLAGHWLSKSPFADTFGHC